MDVLCRYKYLLFSDSAMGCAGICGFVNVCREMMGQDQEVGPTRECQQLVEAEEEDVDEALIPGRLLVVVWALGGNLDHLGTSWTVVF